MDRVRTALLEAAEQIADLTPEILAALLLLALFLVIGVLLSNGLARMLRRGDRSSRYARILSRGVRAAFFVIGLVLGLQVLGLTALASSLLATGGLLAVILGFAFKEIGENLLAGLFLGVSRSFEIGDLIESSGYVGHVKMIDFRQVWIRAADGRDIFIPSAQIFRNVLVNYTRDGLRRGDFTIGLDYAEDLDGACTLLLDVVRGVEHVLEQPAPNVRISSFEAQYCELKVIFWTNTDDGPGLAAVQAKVMAVCVAELKRTGHVLSSDVTTSVSIAGGDATSQ